MGPAGTVRRVGVGWEGRGCFGDVVAVSVHHDIDLALYIFEYFFSCGCRSKPATCAKNGTYLVPFFCYLVRIHADARTS